MIKIILKLTYQGEDVEIVNEDGTYNLAFLDTILMVQTKDKKNITTISAHYTAFLTVTDTIDYSSDKKILKYDVMKWSNSLLIHSETIEQYSFSFDLTNNKIVIEDLINETTHTFTFDEYKRATKYLKTKNNETIHEITFTYENIDKKYHETILNEN